MSIFDNVAAGLTLHVTHDHALRERVTHALQEVGLWEEVEGRLDEPRISLSGGQQQRLCIARSIIVEPDVPLMDEPTSALDPRGTARIEALTHELKTKYTIILVTHHTEQVRRVADSTAFFLEGELIERGPTDKVFINPNDERAERSVTGRLG